MAKKGKTLDINQDLPFEKATWTFQKIGFTAFLGIVLASILGFTGGAGPYNIKTDRVNTVQVEYQPYARVLTPTSMVISLQNTSEFWLDNNFVNIHEIESIAPEPLETITTGDRILYRFRPNTTKSYHIVMNLHPQKPGKYSGVIGQGNNQVQINQFIYP